MHRPTLGRNSVLEYKPFLALGMELPSELTQTPSTYHSSGKKPVNPLIKEQYLIFQRKPKAPVIAAKTDYQQLACPNYGTCRE